MFGCLQERVEEKWLAAARGEGASAFLPFFPFMDWRQETLGFLASGAWKIAGERGRRERERLGRKSYLVFLSFIKTIQVHVYINTESSDPNPKLP